MLGKLPPIYFYLPQSDWQDNMPQKVDAYWSGFRRGIYCWTLQTYLRLKADGFPCKLVGTIPTEGIILAHWDSLPTDLQPSSKQLIVCFQADRARHPYAQIHIVQNPQGLLTQLMVLGDKYLLPGLICYMPLWPQPGLIPRRLERDNHFENIAFFGLEENLLPELQGTAWREQVNTLGLQWNIVSDFEHWHDYSNVDAVLAVRSFTKRDYTWKPATKLYNAWHAGVPAILGCESAFQAERKSELDYIEVTSIQEVVSALKQLRDEPKLRRAIVENGRIRAQETSPEKLTKRWSTLIIDTIVPAYDRWCKASSLTQQLFIRRRSLAIQSRGTRKSLQKWRNQIGFRTRVRSLLSQSRGS